MTQHEKWMQQAILQARKGEGLTAPNPCVGAVIVKNETLLGSGHQTVLTLVSH